jgi:hypothetical protein
MWFNLTGDERLGRCATEGCGGQPTFRLEAGGIGSNYCSGCREQIEYVPPEPEPNEANDYFARGINMPGVTDR